MRGGPRARPYSFQNSANKSLYCRVWLIAVGQLLEREVNLLRIDLSKVKPHAQIGELLRSLRLSRRSATTDS